MKPCTVALVSMALLTLAGEPRLLIAEDLFPKVTKIKSPEIKQAVDEFNKEKKQLESTYQSLLTDLKSKYQVAVSAAQTKLKESLEKARQDATVQNQLDDAVAIRDAIGEVEQLSTDPPSSNASPAKNAPTSQAGSMIAALPKANKPLAEMSIRDVQQAIAGRWLGNNGDVWIIHPNGVLDITTGKETFRQPLSFRYLNGKYFVARFDQDGHYSVYVTQDFETLDNSYGNKFKLRRAPQEGN